MPSMRASFQESREISVLLHDKSASGIKCKATNVHSFTSISDIDINHAPHILVFTNALQLDEIADFVHRANDCKHLKVLLVRQDVHQNWITQLLAKADLRTLKNLLVHTGLAVPKRILKAWQYGAQNNLIADAAVIGDRLFVLDCALNRYEINFEQLKALTKIPRSARSQFTVSEEGSHIFWPDYDVDLDLESLRVVLNPDVAEKALARKLAHDRQFGATVARLRSKRKLRQGDITGLTDRQIRRIESGEQHASLKSLQLLAKAHGLPLKQYLSRIAKSSILSKLPVLKREPS